MAFYFDAFEERQPPPPLSYSPWRELLWQYLATITLIIGAWYLYWRWSASLNFDALWFAIPLVVAETAAYVGLVLFVFNLWRDEPPRPREPPASINACLEEPLAKDRPISVDIFFATYSEDPELVRLGLIDAKKLDYPFPIDLRIHVLDDGRRPAMAAVAREEGVNYLTRANNIGFKAGNLRNAIEQTSGDFIVICDADTRPFPTMLARCLGYFRDPKMAWVQTPQWFFDLPEGTRLPDWLGKRLYAPGRWIGRAVEAIAGPISIGYDPYVNDPKMFYDVILRRRNWANAAFCCGAGSIHRREAVLEAALRAYGAQIDRLALKSIRKAARHSGETALAGPVEAMIRSGLAHEHEFTPYKFHVSEDIYTSIELHSDRERGWKSVLHPYIESKMLSPQDLLSWTVQRFKYAGGTLDIAFNDNPIIRSGLTLRQKVMYAATFWSYLGSIWNIVFLISPMIYFYFNISPVKAYSGDFFIHFLPFVMSLELAMMIGTWGVPGYAAKSSYLSFFPINFRALWTALRGQKISFPVTPKQRQTGRHLSIVRPQIAVVFLTLSGLVLAVGLQLGGFRTYSTAGLLSNAFWGLNNVFAMLGIIRAAFWRPMEENNDLP